MSIASDALAAHTLSVMRSALLRRKIRGRCVRSSVLSGAGSYGKRRKVSITIRLRRRATNGAGERESGSKGLSRDYREILRVEVAMPRTGRSGGVSGMLHRTTVRRADLIEDTVDSLVKQWVVFIRRRIPQSRPLKRGAQRWNASQRCGTPRSSLQFIWKPRNPEN